MAYKNEDRLFTQALMHLRQGNVRALCAFARTFGLENARERLDDEKIRGDFGGFTTSYCGYDYAEQRWLGGPRDLCQTGRETSA